MSYKVLILTVVTLLLSVCQLQAEVINSRWVGGEHGVWEVSNNWEPPIVPDNSGSQTFAVTISHDARLDLGENHIINELNCYGNVELSKDQDWLSLRLVGPNGLRNHGYLITEIEMFRINEILRNLEGSSIEMRGDIEDAGNGDFENDGLLIVSTRNHVLFNQLHNRSQIIIFGGACDINGYLDNDKAGTIQGFGVLGGALPFMNNKGRICSTGGTLAIATAGSFLNRGTICNAPLASLNVMLLEPPSDANNFQTIEVNAGGGVAFDCNLINEPNAVVELLGGTLAAKTITQKAGAIFQGFGGITGNVIIKPNATIKLTGPTNIVGDMTIEEYATLDISDGTVLITGLTRCNGGTIRIKGGTIITQGGTSGVCQSIILD